MQIKMYLFFLPQFSNPNHIHVSQTKNLCFSCIDNLEKLAEYIKIN